MIQDWWRSLLKHSRLALLGLRVNLVAVTLPAPTPCTQRMKSPAWLAAVVVYSLLFPCVALNSKAAAVTIGTSLKGLLVPTSMIVSTSQGAPKKEADPGYVTVPFSAGVQLLSLCLWLSILRVHQLLL